MQRWLWAAAFTLGDALLSGCAFQRPPAPAPVTVMSTPRPNPPATVHHKPASPAPAGPAAVGATPASVAQPENASPQLVPAALPPATVPPPAGPPGDASQYIEPPPR